MHDIEVFYDGDCPVCRWEVRFYSRMDQDHRVRWTDIETLRDEALPAQKTRADLLGRFHVRDIAAPKDDHGTDTEWHIGVEAFARIWQVLPGFRHVAFLFEVHGIRQLTLIAYRLFLKWQSWHRRRRSR
ncbi:thiol-disulfide oxidoreductase DCC family protein [Algimonas porphyrae]|uniref:thiol-disulfide oxidoreductase DCC family protein n=1 Tax=Algimonas porphyrae TaxID=1128113 RepID=UPI0024E10B27|nr:DUF393 domain-containing protein [Algimonas porphyrae]